MATYQNQLEPKIYFIKDVEQLVRRNRLTLRRMWMKNTFPVPDGRINNRLFWKACTIDDFLSGSYKNN